MAALPADGESGLLEIYVTTLLFYGLELSLIKNYGNLFRIIIPASCG